MKNKIKYLLPLCLSVALCSCGLNPAEKNNNTQVQMETEGMASAKAESAETESAKNTIFKNSETTVKKNRFENDFIRIWVSTYTFKWLQENLDGTDRQPLPIENALGGDGDEIAEILWLDNDWIYFVSYDDLYRNSVAIARIPFHYDNKPVYDIEKKEVLVELDYEDGFSASDCMITASYMIYTALNKNDKYVLYKYDFDTKEKNALLKADGTYICLDTASLMPLTMDDSFFLLTYDTDTTKRGYSYLYRVSFDTLEKEQVYSHETKDKDIIMTNMAVTGEQSLYFLTSHKSNQDSNTIMKYDGKSGTVSCVLNHKEFEKIIVDETGFLADAETPYDLGIDTIYLSQDRLYIDVLAYWDAKKPAEEEPYKGKTEDLEYDREILLWSELDDLKNWSIEEKLQNYVAEHSTPRVYNDYGEAYYNTNYTSEKDAEVYIYALYEDKVLFSIVKDIPEKNMVESKIDTKSTYMVYDIKSGEFEETDRDDYRISWGDMADD